MFNRKRTLAELIERQQQLDEGKVDVKVKSNDMAVYTATGSRILSLNIPAEEDRWETFPTDHALRQLGQLHTFDWKHWRRMELEECPDMVRDTFADHMGQVFKTRFGLKSTDPFKLIRTQVRGNERVIRAVLGADYGIFQNARALELMQKAFDVLDGENVSVQVYDSFQTEDELCVRVIAPEHAKNEPGEGGSPVFPGVYVGNSEIGTKRVYVRPLVLRQICSNGMMGVREEGTGLARVHRGSMLILENDFNMALADALNLAASQVEQFIGLTQITVVNPLKELGRIWSKNKTRAEFTNERFTTAEAFLNRYIEQFGETRYAIVNALTEVAQTIDDVNGRLAVEELAGEYALSGVQSSEL